jgi:hypothetical protein
VRSDIAGTAAIRARITAIGTKKAASLKSGPLLLRPLNIEGAWLFGVSESPVSPQNHSTNYGISKQLSPASAPTEALLRRDAPINRRTIKWLAAPVDLSEEIQMAREEIIGQELITYEVESDGSRFRMSFSCAGGKEGSLSLPTDCLQSLIMTLPRIMRQALQARYGDETLRLVYPADVIRIERSLDPKTFILTLTTPDAFEVSFSLTGQQIEALREADVAT